MRFDIYGREGLNVGSLPALTHDRQAHYDRATVTDAEEVDNTVNPVVIISDNKNMHRLVVLCYDPFGADL